MSESWPRLAVSGEKLWMSAPVFDLGGILVDGAYEHVAACSDALRSEEIVAPNWKIHRHVGRNGRSLLRKLLREFSHAAETSRLLVLKRNPISISEKVSVEWKFCPDLSSC